MESYLSKSKGEKLIVFFCGWAVDHNDFNMLKDQDYDILFIWDYSQIESNFLSSVDVGAYKEKYLLSYSYGVFVSSCCVDLIDFDRKIAINGTQMPIDDKCGINPRVFYLTVKNLSIESLNRFYERMFLNKVDFERFMSNREFKETDIEKNKLALLNILEFSRRMSPKIYFDKIFVSKQDKIFRYKVFENAFGKDNIIVIDSSHYPFFDFYDIERMIK